LIFGAAVPAFAEVFSSEFLFDPVSEGWDVGVVYCNPDTWNDTGWYHQQLDLEACPPGPGGGLMCIAARLNFLMES